LLTKIVLPAIFIAVSYSVSYADVANCKSLENNDERLACYDAALGAEAEGSDVVVDAGKWIKKVNISDLTDDKNVYLSLESDDLVRARFGSPAPARLLLRCQENTTAATFGFNDNFMASIQGYGTVEYRIDSQDMQRVRANESTDNSVLGLWRGSSSIPFIKKLIGHQKLVVRATPYNESAMTVTFDISGLENVIGELRDTCSW